MYKNTKRISNSIYKFEKNYHLYSTLAQDTALKV